MSILSNIFSVLAVVSMVTTGLVSTSAQTTGVLSAPLSNSSFTYCNWNNYMATSDVEAARQVIGTSAYFYATENTSNNVINGKCVANLVANFVPYVAGHTTNFDLNSFGAVSNVKLRNSSPYLASVSCDSNNTVAIFKDANQNVLTYNTVIGDAGNYNLSSSTETNNALKVTFERKDNNFTGTNTVTVYVNEVLPTNVSSGYRNVSANSSATSYTLVDVTVDKAATTIKETFKVSGVCNSANYVSSSSSSSSSSSVVTSSSSSTSSSNQTKVTVTTTTETVYGGKGVLTRTGGSN